MNAGRGTPLSIAPRRGYPRPNREWGTTADSRHQTSDTRQRRTSSIVKGSTEGQFLPESGMGYRRLQCLQMTCTAGSGFHSEWTFKLHGDVLYMPNLGVYHVELLF